MRAGRFEKNGREIHVSGAEGLFSVDEIQKAVKSYISRAMGHPKGRPEKITITIEKIKERPLSVPILPVRTLDCGSPSEAREIIKSILSKHEIKEKIIEKTLNLLYSGMNMRGAILMDHLTGKRLEPDKERGIRASRLGIEKESLRRLQRYLERMGINTLTVREALILASKVAHCPDIIAEVCISDDPDYTTGYVASREIGYQRIPSIKNKGDRAGGRVFFVRHGSDLDGIIYYLEKRPVMCVMK